MIIKYLVYVLDNNWVKQVPCTREQLLLDGAIESQFPPEASTQLCMPALHLPGAPKGKGKYEMLSMFTLGLESMFHKLYVPAKKWHIHSSFGWY